MMVCCRGHQQQSIIAVWIFLVGVPSALFFLPTNSQEAPPSPSELPVVGRDADTPADVGSVVVLTGADFSSFLTNNPITFVMFYAPWCYWSKLALPEFAGAAQMLSHHDPPVRLAQIDASEYPEIGRSQNVKEYPTLRLYLGGGDPAVPYIPFTGNRNRAQIVHWIDQHLNKDKGLSSKAHADELLKTDHKHLVVLGIFPTATAAASNLTTTTTTFMMLAREFGDNIIFAHTSDDDIKQHIEVNHINKQLATVVSQPRPAGLPTTPYVVLFTPHPKEDSVHLFSGAIEKAALRNFVKELEFPSVSPFTAGRAPRLFEDGRPICVLVIDTSEHAPADLAGERKASDDEAAHHARHAELHEGVLSGVLTRQHSFAEDAFRKIAQQNRSTFVFTTTGNTEPHEKRLLGLVGIGDDDNLPALRIVTFNPQGHGLFQPALKYRPDERKGGGLVENNRPLEMENYVKQFLEDYKSKSIKPFLKSEPIPEEAINAGPVRIIVGQNFVEEVKELNKDVFIEFYAPWCGHCRKLEPALKELGYRLKSVTDVVISKMDATRNEIADISFSGYPTIMFFPAGKKTTPITYQGNRTVADMMKWIKARSSVEFDADALMAATLSEGTAGSRVAGGEDLMVEEL
eukprot:GHVS01062822.1.p1 GENE.GHVS01062822.1~~GHVS01062822.1.p1  ORF type:complete len:630 (-),score=88.22 GHVS01062822.1:716-2605(-)